MNARGGFTLVEMAIGMVLVSVISGLFFLTTESTSSAVSTGMAVAELDTTTLRTLERVCDGLKSASADMVDPQPATPWSGESVDYQRGRGADADGNLLWGPTERIALEYDEADDDVDNDGDGLVDEGRLVWVENAGAAGERRVVLCQDVREYLEGETFDGADENENGLIDERGFALDFDGRSVTVRLSVQARDRRGQVLTGTVERTIAFRNEGD